MRTEIIGQQFDEERALYHLCSASVIDCTFSGPADGESALKEARDIRLENCNFSLRYPLWHVDKFHLVDCRMDEATRAAIWVVPVSSAAISSWKPLNGASGSSISMP